MDEIKRVIHRMVILPLSRPELYEKYGRKSGGGVMLYGPPGCGKTLLARATAGECGLPFVNVRIEDVMDPYLGVSERNLHAAFERARANAPCVLFLDELDALAFARHKHGGSGVAAAGRRTAAGAGRDRLGERAACWCSPPRTRRGTSTRRCCGRAASTG